MSRADRSVTRSSDVGRLVLHIAFEYRVKHHKKAPLTAIAWLYQSSSCLSVCLRAP